MASGFRIEEFLADIDKLTLKGQASDHSKETLKKARDSINKRCKNEMEYLRKHFTLTTLRKARTEYRNALKTHFNGQQLAMTCKDTNGFSVHIAYKYFDLKKAEKGEYTKNEEERKVAYLSGDYRLIIKDAKRMINTAISLLDSDSFYDIASGLLLLTGRRCVEILKTGSFDIVSPNELVFHGQAKTRWRDKDNNKIPPTPYNIYTLCDSGLIVAAMAKLRSIKDFSDVDEKRVNTLTASALNKAVKRNYIDGFIFNRDNTQLSDIQAKNLRAIYVHLAHRLHKPFAELKHFASDMLGHSDAETADNYMEFMLGQSENI